MKLSWLKRKPTLHTDRVTPAERAVSDSLHRSEEVEGLVRELRQRRIINGFTQSLAEAYNRSHLTSRP